MRSKCFLLKLRIKSLIVQMETELEKAKQLFGTILEDQQIQNLLKDENEVGNKVKVESEELKQFIK